MSSLKINNTLKILAEENNLFGLNVVLNNGKGGSELQKVFSTQSKIV